MCCIPPDAAQRRFGWGALHGAAMRRDALGNVWRGVFVGGQLQGEATCEVDGGAYASTLTLEPAGGCARAAGRAGAWPPRLYCP